MPGGAVVILAGPLGHGAQNRAGLPVTQGRQRLRAPGQQRLLVRARLGLPR